MSSSTRAVMNLAGEYGTSEVTIGLSFSSGKKATHFMQDYCYNANAHCIVLSSGKLKKYRCDDHRDGDETGCKWEVRVSCKRNVTIHDSFESHQ
ncbi:hypothetical protein F441_23067 [Phytophthora nicotianae CJ01A1]|uniref:Transposase MuDR plant domain-containing protein n=1 Tax=Phytophthora nicotianae CJ01A1 TaxID=1317063 RepID=W2VQ16_PHYNI|nr:hypothetical protein F441_23067 [Phytophthora nicotianae CJ01A1]